MKKPLPPVQEQDFKSITPQGLRWLDNVRDYTYDLRLLTATLDPSSIGANTTVTEAFTVSGVKVGDHVLYSMSTTFTDDFSIVNAKVTDTDEITLQLHRGKVGSYNPPSEEYTFIVLKNTKS